MLKRREPHSPLQGLERKGEENLVTKSLIKRATGLSDQFLPVHLRPGGPCPLSLNNEGERGGRGKRMAIRHDLKNHFLPLKRTWNIALH